MKCAPAAKGICLHGHEGAGSPVMQTQGNGAHAKERWPELALACCGEHMASDSVMGPMEA